jgi:hypothetical protein
MAMQRRRGWSLFKNRCHVPIRRAFGRIHSQAYHLQKLLTGQMLTTSPRMKRAGKKKSAFNVSTTMLGRRLPNFVTY